MNLHMPLFCALLIGHALADYPLQGDFVARAKNHRAELPGIPFVWPLMFHAMIHAGFVAVLTGRPILGAAEFVLHVVIDYAKCDGRINFDQDQSLHVACKILWAIIA